MPTPPVGQVVSVNVGRAREVNDGTRTYKTGIYKSAIDGPVRVEGVNVAGDEQVDLSVHGGPTKAVYGYPVEHYPQWQAAFPGADFSRGAFGENLTTQGLLEPGVYIGDLYRVGSVLLRVTEPRVPCFKFAQRIGDNRVGKFMLDRGQSGFYFGIVEPGDLRAGDAIEHVDRPQDGVPVSTIVDIFVGRTTDRDTLEAAKQPAALPESWRVLIDEKLARLDAPG